MTYIKRMQQYAPDLIRIRQDIHQHPELGFEEKRTSKLIANELKSYGIDVIEGVGKTGVVGTLRRGSSIRSIGIRADMDALPINENTDLPYTSNNKNTMHACGHDGHTTMLLGAAKYLAKEGCFDGTVHFIFQPAEEGLGGAKAMIKDGLFNRFPLSAIYSMHNMPGIPAATFALCHGPIMAGADNVDIQILGKGGHAALPHTTIDPIVIQAQIITALQRVVARNIDPIKNAVVSVTQVTGGSAYNVIPDNVYIRGNIRYFEAEIGKQLRCAIEKIVASTCEAAGANYHCTFTTIFEPTINTAKHVDVVAKAATRVVGTDNVNANTAALMGSEDFGFMLKQMPGCYLFIGNGDGKHSCMIHNPKYDFNDEILLTGSSLWISLVEQELDAAK